MIICVYMNPTIDKTVYLQKLEIGGTNRPERVIVHGAGKAINTAMVLCALKSDVLVSGLLYRSDGELITGRLRGLDISYDFTELDGASRVNTKLFEKDTQVITEINESGLEVAGEIIDDVAESIILKANAGDTVVLTGSLPPGCDADLYAKMIRGLNKKGVRCVLDASGEALKAGIKEKPFFIKPNVDELEDITGYAPRSKDEILETCRRLIAGGVTYVGVSMGGKGAYLCSKDQCFFAKPLTVEVQSTVGAGDSMVAGIVAHIDGPLDAALRAGVAAATGSLTLEGTALCTKELFDQYYPMVEIISV